MDSPRCPGQRRVEQCSTHEGTSPLDPPAPRTPPVGRASPDARVPGFAEVPKPSQRRALLDPRRDLATGFLGAENNPAWVGLRPTPAFLDSPLCPGPRRVEQCSTHEGHSPLESATLKTTPVGRASPDARVPGFVAVPRPTPRRAMLDPRRDLATGSSGAENNPPWVGLRPTPAFLDSPLCPSQRRVEQCSTHEGHSPLESATLKRTPVGRASPDARVPGFVAVPKPSPRRAELDPRRDLATGSSGAENNPRGSGFARRPRSWIRRCAQALAA